MHQPNLMLAETYGAYAPAMRIDEKSLSGLIDNPIIRSFDVSPDGKNISILVAAGSQRGAPLWLVTEDIAARRVISSHKLWNTVNVIAGFPPQVLYSSSQRFITVQDSANIRVFDARTLELIRAVTGPGGQPTLVPIYVLGASNSDVLVCAFAPLPPPNYNFHTTAVQLEVVDISSGKQLGEWTSDDVPQSVSADGALIAVSSLQSRRGVLPLNVFDVHGEKVAELTGGFSFRKNAGQAKALGRVKGQFVGNREILLTPDGNTDRTGHPSGNGLQLVNINENKVAVRQVITPQNYGPKGAIANSADHQTILIISWYISAWNLRHHWALPPSSPEVLILSRNAKGLTLETALPIHLPGLLGDWNPRVSSDGSVLAVAEDGGVTVLTRNLHSRIPK